MQELLKNPLALALILAWSTSWKGFALWRASRNEQKYWFIGLLLVNTAGLAEIIYLVWFVKKDRYWEKIQKKFKSR